MYIENKFFDLSLNKRGFSSGIFKRVWITVGVWDGEPVTWGIKVFWKEEESSFYLFDIRFKKFQANISWF